MELIAFFIGIFAGAILGISLILINFKNFKKWVKQMNSTSSCKMN